MSDQRSVRTVTVCNPQGLHARPADMFVRLASRFQSKIEVLSGQRRVDGKSILDILTLGAAEGTVLSIEANGEDSEPAVEALARLFETGFSENGEGQQ